jgi:hypothetical protein
VVRSRTQTERLLRLVTYQAVKVEVRINRLNLRMLMCGYRIVEIAWQNSKKKRNARPASPPFYEFSFLLAQRGLAADAAEATQSFPCLSQAFSCSSLLLSKSTERSSECCSVERWSLLVNYNEPVNRRVICYQLFTLDTGGDIAPCARRGGQLATR